MDLKEVEEEIKQFNNDIAELEQTDAEKNKTKIQLCKDIVTILERRRDMFLSISEISNFELLRYSIVKISFIFTFRDFRLIL